MSHRRFGEYLAKLVHLSGHDVSEILEDQSASGRRFGEIALSWGLCRPEHIWEAWANQLGRRSRPSIHAVDLQCVGIDAQAAAAMSGRLARRFGVVPVRKIGETLVVAAETTTVARAAARLPAILRKPMRFVVARAGQIDAALNTYYPAPPNAATHSGSAAPARTPSAAARRGSARPSTAAARKWHD